ncbi:MAG: BatA and WFA domain-containing protein, partial [Lentisphaeraceae bacterium]|nr:BatA and WFA domain-containing protein [Lentisphaeraceae bacterium]
MNFINSFLLWTAAGAALPVLIHMLNREKPKKVTIPTVEFIIKAVQKSSGSRKLNNFLLLLMRMLILFCISLIIARPQIEQFLTSNSEGPVQAVLIIDNSYYTAHKNNTSTVIDDIKEKAKEIVNSLPEGSLISIMTAEENDNGFTAIKDYVMEKIDQLSPAPVNANMRSLITSASEMLNDLNTKSRNRVYILSHMNRGSWDANYALPNLPAEMIYLQPL